MRADRKARVFYNTTDDEGGIDCVIWRLAVEERRHLAIVRFGGRISTPKE